MMFDKGIPPESCVMFEKEWLVCGFCGELLAAKGETSDVPKKCPFCGVKVRKEGKRDV